MNRDDFVRQLRLTVGDSLLWTTISSLCKVIFCLVPPPFFSYKKILLIFNFPIFVLLLIL